MVKIIIKANISLSGNSNNHFLERFRYNSFNSNEDENKFILLLYELRNLGKDYS